MTGPASGVVPLGRSFRQRGTGRRCVTCRSVSWRPPRWPTPPASSPPIRPPPTTSTACPSGTSTAGARCERLRLPRGRAGARSVLRHRRVGAARRRARRPERARAGRGPDASAGGSGARRGRRPRPDAGRFAGGGRRDAGARAGERSTPWCRCSACSSWTTWPERCGAPGRGSRPVGSWRSPCGARSCWRRASRLLGRRAAGGRHARAHQPGQSAGTARRARRALCGGWGRCPSGRHRVVADAAGLARGVLAGDHGHEQSRSVRRAVAEAQRRVRAFVDGELERRQVRALDMDALIAVATVGPAAGPRI